MGKKIKVQRFLQDPACCAIAGIATVANYYNENIDYKITKLITKKKLTNNLKEGLESGEMGFLLNYLGFKTVIMISSDVDYLDYTWSGFSKKKMIDKLQEVCAVSRERLRPRSIMKWLSEKSFNNRLIIDYNFGDYIRTDIDNGIPVIVTFNWTIFFRQCREIKRRFDDIQGEYEDHCVVIYSYNDKGVKICDSHNECYRYKLKNYKSGFYFMSWENLMTCVGFGDIFLVRDYDETIFEKTKKEINGRST